MLDGEVVASDAQRQFPRKPTLDIELGGVGEIAKVLAELLRHFRSAISAAEGANNLGLPSRSNLPITAKRGQHALMSEILAPGFECLWCLAHPFPELRERLAERVRVRIGQPGARERILEDRSDGPSAAPVLAIKASSFELPSRPERHLRYRKERIHRAPQMPAAKLIDPVDDNFPDLIPDREEPGRKRLREFRLDLSRVLDDAPGDQIHVLQFERCDRAVASAREDGEGNDGAVAPLDGRSSRHCPDHVLDLFHRGHALVATSLRHSRLLLGQIEVFGVGIRKA
jgi:hypothetical protein